MALQEYYIGSVGPLLYDDADTYPGLVEPMRAMYSTGRIRAERIISDTVPTAPTEVVRLVDLGGAGAMNPNINDVTASRTFGVNYHNTSTFWMIVMVSADLES